MKLFLITFFAFLSFNLMAVECQEINLDDSYKEYSISGSAFKGLHFQFDTDIKFAMLSNESTWKSSRSKNLKKHLWLFPKVASDIEDNRVGLTVLLVDGVTINIVVNQNKNASSCVIVNSNSADNKIIYDAFDDINETVLANKAITYNNIHSNYDYKSNLIQSVFDDGLFTYVNLVDYLQSSFSVVSIINDKVNVVNNLKYNSKTNTYKIAGLHKHLRFSNDSNNFDIYTK